MPKQANPRRDLWGCAIAAVLAALVSVVAIQMAWPETPAYRLHAFRPPVQAGRAAAVAPPLEPVGMLVGNARRPARTNYLQAVTVVNGATLWANAGRCCTAPVLPGGDAWEANYRLTLAGPGSSWVWLLGGNSTYTKADGTPAGDAPQLDEWEAYGAKPITIGANIVAPYLRTAWSTRGTPQEASRATVWMARQTSGAWSHLEWIPKPDASSFVNLVGWTKEGATYWVYLDTCSPAGCVKTRQQVNPTTGAMVGTPGRLTMVGTPPGWGIYEVIYSTADAAFFAFADELGGDLGSSTGHYAEVWRSDPLPMAGIPAGVVWQKTDITLGRGTDGRPVWDMHWPRKLDGTLDPAGVVLGNCGDGQYADHDGWEVCAWPYPASAPPAALAAVLGPVTPVVVPTPTATPVPTATPGPTVPIIRWVDWSTPPGPSGEATVTATCNPESVCSVSVLAAGEWFEHLGWPGRPIVFRTVGRRAVGTNTATLKVDYSIRVGVGLQLKTVESVPLAALP